MIFFSPQNEAVFDNEPFCCNYSTVHFMCFILTTAIYTFEMMMVWFGFFV